MDQAKWNIIDSESIQKNLTVEADYCVIGTGAGGAMAAAMIAKTGKKIVVIEEGPLKSHKDFNMQEATAYQNLYQESAARKTKDQAITIFQGRAVGGSTTINWATSLRTPSSTLKQWSEKYKVSGIHEKNMNLLFDQVEDEFNISPWQTSPNANNLMLAKGLDALNIPWKTIPRNVKGCKNLGYCGLGCPINAKQSTLVTKIPEALNAGAQLISQLKADRFVIKNGKIEALECIGTSPIKDRQPKVKIIAKQYILAAGAIGSPAILLRSKAPNSRNLIGKRTFIHPVCVSAALTDDAIYANAGAPQSVYSDHFLEGNLSSDPIGFKLETAPMHPVLLSQVVPWFGDSHFELMKKFPYISNILSLLRDGFHDQSIGGEVTLRSDGSPVLDYQINSYLWEGFGRAWLTMAEIQFAAGAKKVIPLHAKTMGFTSLSEAREQIPRLPPTPLLAKLFSAHVMGGLPFGEDENVTVLDSFGKFRELDNLTVVDGSMFPTSLGANPQVSILAFSLRNTAALLKRDKT
jgi:choline dehydrogenase-like flavoprotein